MGIAILCVGRMMKENGFFVVARLMDNDTVGDDDVTQVRQEDSGFKERLTPD